MVVWVIVVIVLWVIGVGLAGGMGFINGSGDSPGARERGVNGSNFIDWTM